ncbi:hypothetical protein [Rhodosalinus sediminis]|uniref:hypothetical protein n=1 Tax=Rhodosalinus sediminis TaxID=1940533 RepID=UPI00235315A1|nr:hypothetical protein [Rhodosalinus sediminis]
MDKYSGHDLFRIVPYGPRAPASLSEAGYYGAADSADWGGFLDAAPKLQEIPEKDWIVLKNNLTHRLCGQELKLGLLRANAKVFSDAGNEEVRLLRPAHEHSLIHDFFFNTFSIFEGIFSRLVEIDGGVDWKKYASEKLFEQEWSRSEGNSLYRDVVALRDRIHQDRAGEKGIEFDECSYDTHFRRNLKALKSLICYLDGDSNIVPVKTNLFSKFIPKSEIHPF